MGIPTMTPKLLESDSGAIVGMATISWDTRWQPDTAVLDLFVHPKLLRVSINPA